MHRVKVTVKLTREMMVPVYDNEIEIVDMGYEYDPCEPDGKGEGYVEYDYSGVEWEDAIRREEDMPKGWEVEDVIVEE